MPDPDPQAVIRAGLYRVRTKINEAEGALKASSRSLRESAEWAHRALLDAQWTNGDPLDHYEGLKVRLLKITDDIAESVRDGDSPSRATVDLFKKELRALSRAVDFEHTALL